MSDLYQIKVAKFKLNIPGEFYHLTMALYDAQGNILSRLDGLATDPTTGAAVAVGNPIQHDIRIWVMSEAFNFWDDRLFQSGQTKLIETNDPNKPGVIFEASAADALAKWADMIAAGDDINSRALDYGIVGGNSNSAFTTLLKAVGIDVNAMIDSGALHISVVTVPGVRDNLLNPPPFDPFPQCFLAGTLIAMADGTHRAIESVAVGDLVLAFNERTENGRGALTPARVTRVYENVCTSIVTLSNGTKTTPDHLFLTAQGEFRPIREVLRHQLALVDASGQDIRLNGDLIAASATEGATLLTVRQHVEGATALAPVDVLGWKTYNLTVEGFHTYIADGLRVHNDCIESGDGFITAQVLGNGILAFYGMDRHGNPLVLAEYFDPVTGQRTLIERAIGFSSNDAVVINRWSRADGQVDENNTAVGEPTIEVQFPDAIITGEEIGSIFGSQIGQAIGGENLYAQVAAGSVLSAILANIGESFHIYANDTILTSGGTQSATLSEATDVALADFDQDLANAFRSQAVGSLSAFLAGELAESLGFDSSSFGDGLLSAATGSVTRTVLDNALTLATTPAGQLPTDFNLFYGLENAAAGALGGFIGSYLAREIVQAENIGGAIGGGIGGAIGTSIGVSIALGGETIIGSVGAGLLAGYGALAPLLAIPIIAAFAFVGTIIGTILGDKIYDALEGWFDDHGRGDAYAEIASGTGQFAEGYTGGQDGDFIGSARDVRDATSRTVNSILEMMGSENASGETIRIHVHHEAYADGIFGENTKHRYYFRILSQDASGTDTELYERGSLHNWNGQQWFDAVTVQALTHMELAGGNIYMQRALENSQATTVEDLFGDLQIANDYYQYLQNKPVIDMLIALDPQSAFSAGWLITILRAEELGVHEMAASDFRYGLAGFLPWYDPARFGSSMADTVLSLDGSSLVLDFNGLDGSDNATLRIANYAALTGFNRITGQHAAGGAGNDLWIAAAGAAASFVDGPMLLDSFSSDTLVGAELGDTIQAGVGQDFIQGREGNDTIDAGTGNDIIIGGEGNDVLQGGLGDDLFVYRRGDGSDTIADSGVAVQRVREGTFAPITEVVPVEIADGEETRIAHQTLIVGAVQNAGFDTLRLATGISPEDLIFQFDGAHLMIGILPQNWEDLPSKPTMSQLTDTIRLTNWLVENSRLEVIAFPNGLILDAMDILRLADPAGTTEAQVYGQTVNYVQGTAGANALAATLGHDIIFGGAGNDWTQGSKKRDIIDGGEGVDTVSYAGTEDGENGVIASLSSGVATKADGSRDTLIGVENLTGTSKADLLTGNGGDNVLDGGAGADTMAGGAGSDTYLVDSTSDVVIEAAGAGTDTVQSSATHTLSANVENLTLTGVSHINGIGNTLNNVITASSGNNILAGGEGIDTLIYASAASGVTVSLALTTAQATGGSGTDTLSGFENLTGSAYNDTLTGNAGDNVLDGGAGTDTASYASAASGVTVSLAVTTAQATGGSGTDTLSGFENLAGSAYNDTLTGDASANVLDGGAGTDTMAGGAGSDTYLVDSSSDVVIEAAGAGIDTVQSSVSYTLSADVETLTLTGTASNDGIGNTLNNIITGNSGNNILDGRGGNDTLIGGAGNDTFIVDSTSDVITEAASAGTDVIQSWVTYTASVNVENLTLLGDAAINATGNGLANTLTGNAGNNVLDGGAGADTMAGGAGNDTYVVDSTSDVVIEAAGAGTDTVQASFSYTLAANLENLTLTGTADLNGTGNTLNNVMTANSGNNVLAGGFGIDTASYVSAAAGVTVSLAVTTAQATGGSGTDTLSGFENLTGSAHNDTLTGNSDYNVLNGGSGNDTLYGGAGYDGLAGGEGNDTLDGGSGYDQLFGDAGDDTLYGGAGYDDLVGGDGNDMLYGGADYDWLDGGAGIDTAVFSDVAANYEMEWDGEELLIEHVGGTGTDEWDFLKSIEFLQFADGAMAFLAAGGEEDLTIVGTSGGDIILGNDGDDTLTGNGGDDRVDGEAGNDTIDGGSGNNLLAGGSGTDTVSYASAQSGVTVSLALTTAQTTAGSGMDTLTGFENIMGSAYSDTLTGNSDRNGLDGGAGNDTLDGGGGRDVLDGGAGIDTAVFSDVAANYEMEWDGEELSIVHVGGTEADGWDWLTNIEFLQFADGTIAVEDVGVILGDEAGNVLVGTAQNDVIRGKAGDDTLTGNGGNDRLDGGSGNDTLYGGAGSDEMFGDAGDDTLDGGAGSDVMAGGAGNDAYIVDRASDAVTELADEGSDTILSSVSYTASAHVENLTLTGTAAINGTGNALDNVITGNSAANTLSGGAGNDSLDGAAGNDLLYGNNNDDLIHGGTGNDLLDGGAGIDSMAGGVGDDIYVVDDAGDVVTELAGEGIDTVQSGIAYTLAENVENLTLTGAAAINANGNALDNLLVGNAADNVLDGGAGNDTLMGGAGNDTAVFSDVYANYQIDTGVDQTYVEHISGSITVLNGIEFLQFANMSIPAPTPPAPIVGDEGDDLLTGSGGGDTISGLGGNDTVIGAGGDDILTGGSGDDIIDGGAGHDTAVFSDDQWNYTIGFHGDQLYVWHSDGSAVDGVDLLTGVEVLQFANGDVLTPMSYSGDESADILIGGGGDDILKGFGGDDILAGGAGYDIIDGGTGNDTAVFSDVAANYQIAWYEGQLYVQHIADLDGTDRLIGIEMLQFADGTIAAPIELDLTGTEGDDTLIGTAANDVISGGGGNDVLTGNGGADFIDGGAGIDTAVYSDVAANYQMQWYGGQLYVLHAGGMGLDFMDLLSGIEFLQFSDGTVPVPAGPSIIQGDDADNTLVGTAGDDLMSGEAGNDLLTGGEGDDTISGGIGSDTAVFSDVYANYQVIADDGQTYISHIGGTGSDGTDLLNGIEFLQFADQTVSSPAEARIMVGSDQDDALEGGNGDDVVYAFDGNDILQGGLGNDVLRGGMGDDVYVLSLGDGQDRILEEGGSDRLVFEGGADPSALWFAQNNSDLVISRLGTGDSVTVSGWFTPIGPNLHIEDIHAADGAKVLHAADVNSLISQMAAFSAQVGSDPSAVLPSDLPPEYQVAVNSVWQAA